MSSQGWYILNETTSQNFPLSGQFLGLKFGKHVGFSLSEHCKWGTSRPQRISYKGSRSKIVLRNFEMVK